MKNIKVEIKKNKMIIEVDLSKEFGESGSGKSIIIASSEGNQKIEEGVFMGLNVYKKKEK